MSVFKNINGFAGKYEKLDKFAIFCAVHLLPTMLAFLLLVAAVKHNFQMFLYPTLTGLFSAFVVSKIIYIFYKEKRPARLKDTKLLIPIPKNPSFPSRHASLVFGLSFCLFFYNEFLAIIFLLCSCLVAMARVFCGVHWFRDVLAGMIIGFGSAILMYALLNYINL
ncbi:MAG: phosphatase PAP2 family protein [Candidatus Staskawiczbacteria bacterium]